MHRSDVLINIFGEEKAHTIYAENLQKEKTTREKEKLYCVSDDLVGFLPYLFAYHYKVFADIIFGNLFTLMIRHAKQI